MGTRLKAAVALALLLRASCGRSAQLHLVTYSSVFDARLSLPLSTAARHGLTPHVLGLEGAKIVWATGLGPAQNAYREYVFNRTEPDDVVVIFDAYDVMFQAGEVELLETFLALERRTGRHIIYNAETQCSSPRVAEYPPCSSPWCYLNCGVIMGRSFALRVVYEKALPAMIVDAQGKSLRAQNWHTNFFLEHQDLAMIDSQCEVSQAVTAIPSFYSNADNVPSEQSTKGASYLRIVDGKLVNTLTNTSPPILHLPGPAHWPDIQHPERVGTCLVYEFFRAYGNPQLAAETEWQGTHFGRGGHFGRFPWKDACTTYISPIDFVGIRVMRLGDWIMWGYWRFRVPVGVAAGLGLVFCCRSRRLATFATQLYKFCKQTRLSEKDMDV